MPEQQQSAEQRRIAELEAQNVALQEQLGVVNLTLAGQLAGVEYVDGFARCMNQACEAFNDDRPLKLQRETKEVRAPDFTSVVISSTTTTVPMDDADLACPECGLPSAVLTSKPPVYPKMAPA